MSNLFALVSLRPCALAPLCPCALVREARSGDRVRGMCIHVLLAYNHPGHSAWFLSRIEQVFPDTMCALPTW